MNTARAHFPPSPNSGYGGRSRAAWLFSRHGGTAFLYYLLVALLFAAFTPSAHAIRLRPQSGATADTSAPWSPDFSAIARRATAETRVGVSDDHAPGRYLLVVAEKPDGTMVLVGCVYETASGLREWLNRDPIEERGGLNLYGAFFNGPVDNVDTDGRGIFSIPRNGINAPPVVIISPIPAPPPPPAPRPPRVDTLSPNYNYTYNSPLLLGAPALRGTAVGARIDSLNNNIISSLLPLPKICPAAKLAGNGADDVLNGVRLRNQLAGQEIAGGHAFTKHGAEFGFKSPQEMAAHIENVMNNPTAIRNLSKGRTAYWDDATQCVVIRNPNAIDGGTVFKPTAGRGYFEGLK